MKKIITMALSCMMALNIIFNTTTIVSAERGWTQHEDVDLRVGLLTDTHMRNADTTSDIVNHILDSQVEIAGGKMDGMVLAGDVTFYNATDDCTDRRHYRNMYNSIREKMPGADIIYAMGNHEFPLGMTDAETSVKARTAFVEGTGQDLNAHMVMGEGYHFIALAPENANSLLSEETKAWAKQEIENAIGSDSTNGVKDESGNYSFPTGEVPDSTKPVFVVLHAPLPGTFPGAAEGGNVTEFLAYLKTRPQVIMLNGHMHVSAQIPYTIRQDGFTIFQGSVNDGIYISDNAFKNPPYTGSDAFLHQGAMIEVDNNVVKIYKLDYDNNVEIGNPWTIDIPQIVMNLRDDNPNNDNDAFLYSDENRAKVQSAAQFPTGAEVVVEALANSVKVTYPNTACMTKWDSVQQDNFIRGYKVEVVDENGYTVSVLKHQSDYYLKPENRKASYTQELTGMDGGKTYNVNVYPIMPLGDDGTLGAPISAKVTMPVDKSKEDVIRYEIEDYCPEAKLNKESVYASGGGICISAQGGMVEGVQQLLRPSGDAKPFTFDIDVELPVDGTYKIEYGLGYKSSQNLSKVTLTLDDTIIIGDNTTKGDIDRSLNQTYPWKNYIPLYTYYADSQVLKGGKHKVTVTVDLPESSNQPYLFCADYIEFDPVMASVDLKHDERIEFENYASSVSIEQTDGTFGTASVREWKNCSAGKCFAVDTADNLAKNTYESFAIPVHVKHEGYYQMTFVECYGMSYTDIFLDSESGTQLDSGMTTVLDDQKDSNGNYTYFGPGWARKQTGTKNVYLPEGYHNLIIRIQKRNYQQDFAAYLDYIEFKPITEIIEKESEFLIEFENYSSDLNGNTPEVRSFDTAHGKKYLASGGAGSQTVVLDVPVYVEEDSTFYVDAAIGQANHLSLVTLLKNGNEELYSFTAGNAKREYFKDSPFALYEYKFPVKLDKGFQTLTFSMAPRSNYSNTVAYALDYFHLAPDTDGVVEEGKVTTIEFEDVVKKIDKIEQSDGSAIKNTDGSFYTPSVGNAPNCSGTKYAVLDTPDGQAVDSYYDIPVKIDVKNEGEYRIKYVVTGNLVAPGVFVDSKTENIAAPRIKIDDSKNTQGSYDYYNSTWATAGVHEGTIHLKEGIHTINFRNYKRSGNFADYAQHFDFVEISPIESFNVSNGTASVTAITDRPVTGTAILALYNGGRMVAVDYVPMNNSKLIEISIPVSETVTSAKVMTWVDFNSLKPIEDAKEFKVEKIVSEPFAGDDTINVVYLGDSIYNGAGASSIDERFVNQVGAWYEETYEKNGVTVNNIYKGVGGTTTEYSVARLYRDVIPYEPDVVYLSHTCNDGNRDTRRNMEIIVRTLMSLPNPPYIIITRFTNRDLSLSNGYGNQVAEHYGLPVIDDRDAYIRALEENKNTMSDYFIADGIHPNDLGYDVITKEVISCMETGKYWHRPVMPEKKLVENSGKIVSMDIFSSQSSNVKATGWTAYSGSTKAGMKSTAVGDTLEFSFTGNVLAFEYGLNENASKIEVWIDGELKMTCNPYYKGQTTNKMVGKEGSFVLDLTNGTHDVVMKTVSGQKTGVTPETVVYDIFTGVMEQ